MSDNIFKLLDRFLKLHEKEVSGRAAALDASLKGRLRQCAEGRLSKDDRAALCGEIRDNREALAFLAREIQTAAASGNQKKEKANEAGTNQSAA